MHMIGVKAMPLMSLDQLYDIDNIIQLKNLFKMNHLLFARDPIRAKKMADLMGLVDWRPRTNHLPEDELDSDDELSIIQDVDPEPEAEHEEQIEPHAHNERNNAIDSSDDEDENVQAQEDALEYLLTNDQLQASWNHKNVGFI